MDFILDRLGERSTQMVILALGALLVYIGVSTETFTGYISQFSNLIGLLALAGVLILPDDMNPIEFIASKFGSWTTRIALMAMVAILAYAGVTQEEIGEFLTEFENIVYFAAFAGMAAFPKGQKTT